MLEADQTKVGGSRVGAVAFVRSVISALGAATMPSVRTRSSYRDIEHV
jgi:hypothetical protein